jgi:hypothetical protein
VTQAQSAFLAWSPFGGSASASESDGRLCGDRFRLDGVQLLFCEIEPWRAIHGPWTCRSCNEHSASWHRHDRSDQDPAIFQIAGSLTSAIEIARKHLIEIIERNEPRDAVWLLDQNGRLRFDWFGRKPSAESNDRQVNECPAAISAAALPADLRRDSAGLARPPASALSLFRVSPG